MFGQNTIKQSDGMCVCCLATDRKLSKLASYVNLYQKLSNMLQLTESQIPVLESKPQVCWECHKTLNNLIKFQQKIKTAQEFFANGQFINKKISSLSNLTTVTKIGHDLEITHETSEEDIKPVFSPFKDEQLETEAYDIPLDYNIDYENDIPIKYEKYSESDEFNSKLKTEEQSPTTVSKSTVTKEKKRKKPELNYKIVQLDINEDNLMTLVRTVPIDENELKSILERERSSNIYTTKRYKCDTCVFGFQSKIQLLQHNKRYHLESNMYICDICQKRTSNKENLESHCKSHFSKFECTVCGYICLKNWQMDYHLKRGHSRRVECKKCQALFNTTHEFFRHYQFHTKFVCDYCGRIFRKKKGIESHIRSKHTQAKCKECGKFFKAYASLVKHINLKHVSEVSANAYCVECDMQFDNVHLYERHLYSSVKHQPAHKRQIPCPECNKIFAKVTAMKNHYSLVHLKTTKHYCEPCSRYFLNGYRLRCHIASFHNKLKKPKTKLCPHCGQRFSANRILINHIRTHTGERPYECSHCPAAFAQRSALVTHTRSQHHIDITAKRPVGGYLSHTETQLL